VAVRPYFTGARCRCRFHRLALNKLLRQAFHSRRTHEIDRANFHHPGPRGTRQISSKKLSATYPKVAIQVARIGGNSDQAYYPARRCSRPLTSGRTPAAQALSRNASRRRA
jgi:hypothetical protein